jgi:hypothetical protein
MADTENTKGLSSELRRAIYDAITTTNFVPCLGEISEREAEMIEHFGSPVAAGYMSEESGWQLDDDDAEAIRNG